MNTLKIIPLGGMGNVTKNMFVYEYDDELLIVDCGIGFPEQYMLGVDVLIPDVSYIQKRLKEGAKIVGLCLTHGHDDHIAALPYILPMINADFPLFGSPLTAAFAMQRMEDSAVQREVQLYPERLGGQGGGQNSGQGGGYGSSFDDGRGDSYGGGHGSDRLRLGKYFEVETIRVTHSVPDARHLVIHTPEGICYHGSDFKFDMNPVDGLRSDFNKIALIGESGVLCALVDCLRVEREVWAPSESSIFETLEREIRDCKGKFFVTLMSSNIHRIQQTIDVAVEHGRKVVFIGRSIEQNAQIAQQLNMLKVPKKSLVLKKHMDQYPDRELCIVIAGSQGQPGSSLVRAVYGEHPLISIGKQDKVVFSTEPIPGNEPNVYDTIDELSRNGIDVAYSDVDDNLHVSGHAGLVEQQLLVSMVKPRYLLPIGGTDRHRVQFRHVVTNLGYREHDVLLPKSGQVVEFRSGESILAETLMLKDLMVDGLGIGDVGDIVLADRKNMAEEGMVVVIIPELGGRLNLDNIQVVSRGFVFMKNADEMVHAIKEETVAVLSTNENLDEAELKKLIEKKLTKRLDKLIGRTPLVLPVFFSAEM